MHISNHIQRSIDLHRIDLISLQHCDPKNVPIFVSEDHLISLHASDYTS